MKHDYGQGEWHLPKDCGQIPHQVNSNNADELTHIVHVKIKALLSLNFVYFFPALGFKESMDRLLNMQEKITARGIVAGTSFSEWCLQNEGTCYF